jgi:hypothetical protein
MSRLENRKIEPDRQKLLDELSETFENIKLIYQGHFDISGRNDVTAHSFFAPEIKLDACIKQHIREWINSRGWQYSRQSNDNSTTKRRDEFIYLAPKIPVSLKCGFHVTRACSVPSILKDGLLPSNSGRQINELKREDCEGNIYLCEKIGSVEDAGIKDSYSAHWWLDEFRKVNRFNDLNWVILEIDLSQISDVKLYKDIWSRSGIVVNGVASIPPSAIKLVYE